MLTFEFRSEKVWLSVWEALNDTYHHFASYAYKCITVFENAVAEELIQELDSCGYKYKIVE